MIRKPPLGTAGRGFQFNPVVSFNKLMAGMVNDVVADDVRMMTVIHPPGGSVLSMGHMWRMTDAQCSASRHITIIAMPMPKLIIDDYQ
ncbi:MAG: hypothetical protein Alpg2KO_12650 [Alphaproteobacteria bacterium]